MDSDGDAAGQRAGALGRSRVTRARHTLLGTMMTLALCACSTAEVEQGADASKLDADMEKRAQEIEARADEAVAAAEREASAELTRIEAEARSAEAAGEAAVEQ